MAKSGRVWIVLALVVAGAVAGQAVYAQISTGSAARPVVGLDPFNPVLTTNIDVPLLISPDPLVPEARIVRRPPTRDPVRPPTRSPFIP